VWNISQGWWWEVSLEILCDRRRFVDDEKRLIPKEPFFTLTEFYNMILVCGSIISLDDRKEQRMECISNLMKEQAFVSKMS
jgi:hypothetical protein